MYTHAKDLHLNGRQTDPPTSRSLNFHLHSLWLFTFSDLKTIVGPKTAFGVLNALAAPVYKIESKHPLEAYSLFLATFWVWINLLPFVIDNQRRTESILEDAQNKPWRPLPSKRMSQREARTVMLILYPVALVVSIIVGGWRQAITLVALGYWYNSLGGSAGVLSKNFINACGFLCFASGAMEVVLGKSLQISTVLGIWFLIIWAVVFTTVQIQDIPDQVGDALCGRKTLPLAFGDFNTRCVTASFMAIWSILCPYFWRAPPGLSAAFGLLGIFIGFRTLFKKQVEDDKRTFVLWNGWMSILYTTPLIAHLAKEEWF